MKEYIVVVELEYPIEGLSDDPLMEHDIHIEEFKTYGEAKAYKDKIDGEGEINPEYAPIATIYHRDNTSGDTESCVSCRHWSSKNRSFGKCSIKDKTTIAEDRCDGFMRLKYDDMLRRYNENRWKTMDECHICQNCRHYHRIIGEHAHYCDTRNETYSTGLFTCDRFDKGITGEDISVDEALRRIMR